MPTKTCSDHAREFPNEVAELDLTEFGSNRTNPDGLRYSCRRCTNTIKRRARDLRRPATARDAAPEPTPLEAAYQRAEKQTNDKRLKREHAALIDENGKLKALLAEAGAMRRAPDVVVYKQPSWERSDAVAVAVASDWHVEEPVVAEAVHGLNAYNLEVAKARAERFFRNSLRLAMINARDSKIRTLYMPFLGDFFSGWIHEELIASNLLPPGEAARFWQGLVISGIDYVLRESDFAIESDMIPGNHGRMTRQMHLGDPTGTSLETMAYHGVACRYEGNQRVRLHVSEHAMIYRRFFERFRMRLIHGYEVKYGGGVGGLTIPLNKAIAQWDVARRASLTVLGHFHQFFDGGNFVVNGSMIGYNTFAQAIKAKFEEPRQAFFLIHARNGGEKSVTAPVWLDDARKVVEPLND